jgi:hypothetical protein
MYFNLFAVFLVSGLWHGAAMTFIIWGAIHGFIIVIEKAFAKQRKSLYNKLKINQGHLAHKMIFIPMIFTIVCFAWIFFRANSFNDAIVLIRNIGVNNIENLNNGYIYELGLVKYEFIISLIAIGLLVAFEWYHKRNNVEEILNQKPISLRWGAYLGISMVIFLFGIYGPGEASEFIYFQF